MVRTSVADNDGRDLVVDCVGEDDLVLANTVGVVGTDVYDLDDRVDDDFGPADDGYSDVAVDTDGCGPVDFDYGYIDVGDDALKAN